MLVLQEDSSLLRVRYKWEANVHGFCMPVKMTGAREIFKWISPTSEWQTMELKGMTKKDLKVDTDDFYIEVKEAGNK